MKPLNRSFTKPRAGARPDPDALAAQALAFIANDPERLQRFLVLTGFDPGGLRQAAARDGFAASILTYLAEDEDLLVAFAAHDGLEPEAVGRLARAAGRSCEPEP